MNVAIWQLAGDRAAYGPDAGRFILTTPDGEDEPFHAEAAIFDTPEDAAAFARSHGARVVALSVA